MVSIQESICSEEAKLLALVMARQVGKELTYKVKSFMSIKGTIHFFFLFKINSWIIKHADRPRNPSYHLSYSLVAKVFILGHGYFKILSLLDHISLINYARDHHAKSEVSNFRCSSVDTSQFSWMIGNKLLFLKTVKEYIWNSKYIQRINQLRPSRFSIRTRKRVLSPIKTVVHLLGVVLLSKHLNSICFKVQIPK